MKETIEKIKGINLETLWPETEKWLIEHVFNTNTLYQLIIIIISFIASSFLYRLMSDKIKTSIEKSRFSARHKRVSRSMTKLIFPLLTLIIIFSITKIAASDLVGVDVWLISHMMKILLAWIIIRSMVQFIDNGAIRNSFSLMIWVIAALSIFGVLDDASKALDQININIGEFRLSLLAVFKSAFFLFILVYAASASSSVVEHRIARSKNLTRSSQVLISKIIRIALIVLALLIGITSSGIDLSLFAVFGGAIGLGIGFGLQKGIANLFSGIILLFDKSINPGDIIELENGTYGIVHQMAARYTEVITMDKRSYLIPNEELITQRVINWSHNDSTILVSVDFGVHYGSDPHQVIKVALKAVQTPKRILRNTIPACYMTEFADSAINFRLSFWIEDPENGIGNIKGEVLLALWDTFKENNISIPYPHREVYMHNAVV